MYLQVLQSLFDTIDSNIALSQISPELRREAELQVPGDPPHQHPQHRDLRHRAYEEAYKVSKYLRLRLLERGSIHVTHGFPYYFKALTI